VKSVPNTKVLHQLYTVCALPEFMERSMTEKDFYLGLLHRFKIPDKRCILTVNGVYCVGKSLKEAFGVFETIDFTARMILRSLRVGIPSSLSDVISFFNARYNCISMKCFQELISQKMILPFAGRYHLWKSS
jgi:ribulose-5-phosphate 4-epimerase/fuculose-1-phosphate aldolase